VRKSLFLILVFFATAAFAQEESSFTADRPGAATGTDVLPFKSVSWETGFQYDYADGAHSIALPTTMFRFGISRFAELRIQYDGALASDENNRWHYGVQPLTLGTKVRIYDGQTANERLKWLPKTSLLLNLQIPTTPDLAAAMHVAPQAYLLFHNDCTDWLGLDYNVGAEWDGVSARPTTFLALCFGFSMTDNVGAYVETYNYITDYGKDFAIEPYLDFGFNFMVHPRVQLDVYGAFLSDDPKASASVGLGVAWMIK